MMAQTAKKRGRPKGAVTIPHQERAQIVQDALNQLDQGKTTDEIAKSHNIQGRTLRSWLLVDCPAEADHQRARYIAAQLQDSIEDIEDSKEQIPLARARERFRSWAWVAERRLPHLFAQKQEVKMEINHNIAGRLMSARSRVIDHVAPHIVHGSTSHNNVEDAEVVSESKG